MTIAIRPAQRRKARLRLALDGPSKSGKTMTALRLAHLLGKKTCVIDAENGTSELYAGLIYDDVPLTFDVSLLRTSSPDDYTAAISAVAAAGYDVLIVDGISPAWGGAEGMLAQHDRVGGKSSWADWLKVNPMQSRMIGAIQTYPGHVICTMHHQD